MADTLNEATGAGYDAAVASMAHDQSVVAPDAATQASFDQVVKNMFPPPSETAIKTFNGILDAGVNQDKATRAKQIGDSYGLSPTDVMSNFDKMDRLFKIDTLRKHMDQSPVLARQMQDPEFAALAQNDTGNLSTIGNLLGTGLRMGRAALAGTTYDVASATYGIGEGILKTLAPLMDWSAGTLLPQNPLRVAAGGLEEWRKKEADQAAALAGENPNAGFWERGISSGFRSFGQMLPGMAASVTSGNPMPALLFGGGMQGSQSVSKALDAGKSPLTAMTYGMADAVAEVVTEKAPMFKLIGDLKAGAPFLKILGGQMITEIPGELAATAWQNFNEWAYLHPETPISTYLTDLPMAEAETVVSTITMVLLTAGMGHAMSGRARKDAAASTAAQDGVTMQAVLDMAAASKTLEASPKSFAGFVDQAANGGSVYIDANVLEGTLQAAGVDKATFAQSMPQAAAQLEEAASRGGLVEIPVSELTTALPNSGLEKEIVPHLKMDPHAPSQFEAEQFIKTRAEEYQAAAERMMEGKDLDNQLKESAQNVEKQIGAELDSVNRFTPDVNQAYAKFAGAFYAVLGKRTGVTAEQAYVDHPLGWRAQGVVGSNTLAQGEDNGTPRGNDAGGSLDFTGAQWTGNDVHGTIGGTPPARGWSRATRIRGSRGPLVLFRGEKSPLEASHFGLDSLGYSSGNPSSGLGVFSSSLERIAAGHGDVKTYHFDLRNPAYILAEKLPGFNSVKAAHAYRESLRSKGYDGIVIVGGKGRRDVVAFDPHQVIPTVPGHTFNPETHGKFAATLADFAPDKIEDILLRSGWAIITAENPNGEKMGDEENAQRQAALKAELESRSYNIVDAIGRYNSIEHPFVITGITEAEAQELGLKYGQESVLTQRGLVYSKTGEYQRALSVTKHETRPEDYFTEIPSMNVLFSIDLDDAMSPAEPERYGQASHPRPDAVTVEGVHFSPSELTHVNTLFYGRGLKGAERERVMSAADKRLRYRAHFYANTGNDITPEPGVGAHAHLATLTNLYDAQADPLNIATKDATAFESAVLDHGYSGYVSRNFGNQGAVVLLGPQVVQVEGDVSAASPVPAPEYSASKKLAVMLANDSRLPSGSMTPQEWKSAIQRIAPDLYSKLAPTGVLDSTSQEPVYRDQLARSIADKGSKTFSQSATLRSGKETLKSFGLVGKKTYTTREVAAALEARQRKKWGTIAPEDRSPEASSKISRWMVEEIKFEMEHPEKSGLGWYSEKFQKALDKMGDAFPELKTDKNARNTMTALIAITSDGQKVLPNFSQAMDIYGNFRKTGKFETSIGHARQESIDGNMKVLQRLYDQMGPERMASYLMKEDTIANLKKVAKDAGGELSSDYQVHIRMPMAAVELGPKLGAFYANLMGAHGYLTMDRWWSRSFNRYRGTLLMKPTQQGLERFRELSGHPEWTDEETISATIAPHDSYADKKFKDGTELEKAANTLYKAAFENLEDAPFNATDRTFMLATVNRAQKSLKRAGVDMTVADIQAVLWYYEKRLYGELGTRKSADISYEDAAGRVVDKYVGGPNGSALQNTGEQPSVEGQVPGDAAQSGDYSQSGEERGNITFADSLQSPTIITLLKHADLSTALHELGHFYLEVMVDVAKQENAPADVVSDVQKIMKWFGVADMATWDAMTLEQKRPFHEQFARGWEAYLFEGKAPSQELQGPFQRFRAWMVQVYKDIKNLNVTLTDEVRSVFDRMIASEEQITIAEDRAGFAPAFKSAEEAGMTPAEWVTYQNLGADATAAAVDQLQTRSLRNMQWLSNAKDRQIRALQKDAATKRKAVRREVAAEIRQEPVYEAMFYLKHSGNKLSLPILKQMYGEEANAPWRYFSAGKAGLVATDGIDPQQLAEQIGGFKNGDDLVRQLLAADPERDAIEARTDQRMLERYGDLSDATSIERAAEQAIHNDARGRFVAAELAALENANNARVDTGRVNSKGHKITYSAIVQHAKDMAQALTSRRVIRDLKPAALTAAEVRAAKSAARALVKGDLVLAATEKRNEVINHYAAKASMEAAAEIEKGVAYFKRVTEAKKIDQEYLAQIESLLEKYSLRPVSIKEAQKRISLAKWVEDQKALGFEPVVPEDVLNEANRKPFQDMTVEEFRGLRDTIQNIEHLGRLKDKLLTIQKARAFRAVVDDNANAIHNNAKEVKADPSWGRDSWLWKAKSNIAAAFALHRKFANMFREMDAYKDGGTTVSTFVKALNEAGDHEAVMREDATVKLAKLMANIDTAKLFDKKKVFIPELNASLTLEERLMVTLNTGNEGNLQRLMDGDHMTLNQVQAVIDTLSSEEMDFVQGVWDLLDSYRPAIGAQQKRLTGLEPSWVEPREVMTKHGKYRGGYIPAKYATDRSTRALADEAASNIMDQWRAARNNAATRSGFTKDRAAAVKDRPLRKDFGVITQHLTEVAHRLAYQDYLTDANRLLRAAPIDQAIREHYGPEILKALQDTLKDVAQGEVGAQNIFESTFNYLRHGSTIVGLGYRLTTSLLQPIGLTQSMVRIGPKYVMKGLVQWLNPANQNDTWKTITEKSDMMRLRGKTMQREISEIRNTISGHNSALEGSYFYLIQKMQLIADIPTWLGQYHKAIDLGAKEDEAVAQADQAVIDAQGHGQIKDLAGVQRGNSYLKLFTNFYSFFNTTYNLTSEVVGRTNWKNPASVAKAAADFLLLYSVPAALGTLMKAALHAGGGGDDDKKLLAQLISDQLTYLFGTMVGVRELAGGIQGAAGLPGDYQGPASVRFFADVAKLTKQIRQGEADEAFWKALASVTGIVAHLPTGQVSASISGLVALGEGRTQNPGALVVGGPPNHH